jgi:hypothetical protein
MVYFINSLLQNAKWRDKVILNYADKMEVLWEQQNSAFLPDLKETVCDC